MLYVNQFLYKDINLAAIVLHILCLVKAFVFVHLEKVFTCLMRKQVNRDNWPVHNSENTKVIYMRKYTHTCTLIIHILNMSFKNLF